MQSFKLYLQSSQGRSEPVASRSAQTCIRRGRGGGGEERERELTSSSSKQSADLVVVAVSNAR